MSIIDNLKNQSALKDITDIINIDWKHSENQFEDFTREKLLLEMRSTEVPALCTGDINQNGLLDIYIGGARGQAGILLIQNLNGGIYKKEITAFTNDASSEDTDCVFF